MKYMGFTSNQLQYMRDGERLTQNLKIEVERALGVTKLKSQIKRHTYICSPPGAGKTFTVMQVAKEHKVPMLVIQGIQSLNAFVIELATRVYHSNSDDEIIVWVDDCDSMFTTADGLNLWKGAVDPNRNMVSWGKNMISQIGQFEKSEHAAHNLIGEALIGFEKASGIGVEIPTDQVRFIVTSNIPLPDSDEAKFRGTVHLGAFADRFRYKNYDLTPEESWGWLAYLGMENDILGLSKAKKYLLLDWMYWNWERLRSKSMRSLLDYAEDMINYPKDYTNHWNISLKKIKVKR